jgi:hypothetical protein
MSIFFVSSIIWSLNKLTPAIFMLPIVIPAFYQRVFLAIFLFFIRAEPFVFLFYFLFTSYLRSGYPFPTAIYPFSLLFISKNVVAHAQWGAFPYSTLAGL